MSERQTGGEPEAVRSAQALDAPFDIVAYLLASSRDCLEASGTLEVMSDRERYVAWLDELIGELGREARRRAEGR